MKPNRVWIASAFATALLIQGCGGVLFKVKPVVYTPMPDTAKQTEAGGLVARATPLLTDEESQDLFEVNLPLFGVLPVRVELVNNTSAAISLSKAKIRMRNDSGEWRFLTARQTVGLILKRSNVKLYNPPTMKRFKQELGAWSLDTTAVLAVNERRQGIVFLEAPRKNEIQSPTGLILSIEKIEKPIEIKLN